MVVDVASVAERDHHHEEHVVLDRVEDAVVADADAETGPASKGTGSRRAGVLRQQRDSSLDAMPDRWVELAKGSRGRRAQLDTVPAQTHPRSALACSQGMFGPSSAIAASKAATSSASSSAATSSS